MLQDVDRSLTVFNGNEDVVHAEFGKQDFVFLRVGTVSVLSMLRSSTLLVSSSTSTEHYLRLQHLPTIVVQPSAEFLAL